MSDHENESDRDALAEARLEVKTAVEEWFSNVSLYDLFVVKGWQSRTEPAAERAGDTDDAAKALPERLRAAHQAAIHTAWKVPTAVDLLSQAADAIERLLAAQPTAERARDVYDVPRAYLRGRAEADTFRAEIKAVRDVWADRIPGRLNALEFVADLDKVLGIESIET